MKIKLELSPKMLFSLYFSQYWSYGEKESRFDWVIGCCESIGSGIGLIRISEVCEMVKMGSKSGQKSPESAILAVFRPILVVW